MNSIYQIIEWCNKNAGFLSGALTLVYVFATIWLVFLARRQLRYATELERNRVRPFIIFEILLQPPLVMVSVKNIGQTPAYDVRIAVSPNIETLHGGEGVYPAEERASPMSLIARTIAMIAPQREISSMFGTWKRVKNLHTELLFQGTVTYRGADGTEYSEHFVLDLSIYEGLRRPSVKNINNLVTQLELIAGSLGKIADKLHEAGK